MLTEQQKAEINTALEASHGDRAAAATALGMELGLLTKIIHNSRPLRERWSAKAETMAVVPVSPEVAVQKEEKELNKPTLREGLAALIGPDENNLVQLGCAFSEFYGAQFGKVLQIMGGGMVARYLRMEKSINDLEKEIAALTDDGTLEGMMRRGSLEQTLRQHHTALIELQQKCFDRTVKAQLTLALAKERQGGGKGKSTKPGFGVKGDKPVPTTLVNAQPGSTVNLGK